MVSIDSVSVFLVGKYPLFVGNYLFKSFLFREPKRWEERGELLQCRKHMGEGFRGVSETVICFRVSGLVRT
jgi:hypothetical protein